MKIKKLPSGIAATCMIAVMSLTATPAHAASLFALNFGANSTSSNDTQTGASGSVGFMFANEGTDVRVTLNIENTTGSVLFGDNATSSKLTGFGFDLLEGVSYVVDSFVGDAVGGADGHFNELLLNASNSPFDNLDIAVVDNVNGNGKNVNGGNANGALPVGDSANVSFLLDSTQDAANLGLAFQAAFFSVPTLQASLRFQQVEGGNNNGASDKLLFNPTLSNNPPIVTPLPAGLLLILSALGVFGLLARRRVA